MCVTSTEWIMMTLNDNQINSKFNTYYNYMYMYDCIKWSNTVSIVKYNVTIIN